MSEWRSDLWFVVPNATQTALWLKQGQWPHLVLPRRFWSPQLEPFRQAMHEALGFPAEVLRCAYAHYDREAKHIQAVYILESNALPSEGWVALEDLSPLPLPPEVWNDLLQQLYSAQPPKDRVPWANPGWLAQAQAWITHTLHNLGYRVQTIEPIKNWSLSCVVRVHTDQGLVYFKVSNNLPLFGHEPLLTQTLAQWFPQRVPKPLAIELDQRWMLLPNIGSNLREQPLDLAGACELLHAYSHMQFTLSLQPQALLQAGCLDRRMPHLVQHLSQMLQDPYVMQQLTPQEVQAALGLEKQWHQSCAALQEHLAYSLVHGDWHSGNMAAPAGQVCFFDWTDACLAHPLLDLAFWLLDIEAQMQEGWRPALLQAYAQPWGLTAQDLEAPLALANLVSALHQTVSYWQIETHIEEATRFEMVGSTAYWLRRCIQLSGAVLSG